MTSLTDEFIGKTFGKDSQLTVISWDGERKKGNKLYTVHCSICALDAEMNGSATYLFSKGHLVEGRYPCSCSKSPKLSKEQILLKVKRRCDEVGYKFISLSGEYNKTMSRVILSCPIHGHMEPKTINDFLSGRNCLECRRDLVKEKLKIDDTDFIRRFLATGNFHPDTKFRRSDKLTIANKYREGIKYHWWVECPVCNKVVEGHVSNMLGGRPPCACSSQGKTYAYIHQIKDQGEVIALKFGVATNPDRRLLDQSKSCIYSMERLCLWKFKDSSDCRSAESEVKRVVPTRFLTKEIISDGWTETCEEKHLGQVLGIFEKFGGKIWQQ